MDKPRFILELEKNKNVFSSLNVGLQPTGFKDFIGKKLEIVYEETHLNDNFEIGWDNIIYKTAQPFYIYLSFNENGWNIVIYYKPNQFNELKLFLIQLLKQFKNATNNNIGTTREN